MPPSPQTSRRSVPPTNVSFARVLEVTSEEECYRYLNRTLHPQGLACPNGHSVRTSRASDHQLHPSGPDAVCPECGAAFNVLTGTIWAESSYSCQQIMAILRGFVDGASMEAVADVLDLDATKLRTLRRRMRNALQHGAPIGLQTTR